MLPISAESTKVRDFMRNKINEGEVATMAMLSGVAGRDLSKKLNIIYGAIRALEKEGIVFYKVRRVGWKRVALDTPEIIDGETGVTKQVNRKIRRSLKRLAAVKFDALNNEDRIRHSVVSSQIGTLAMFSGSAARDKVMAATIGNGAALDNAKLLELFSK